MPINEFEARQPMVNVARMLAGSGRPKEDIVAAATETGALMYDYTWAVNHWKWKDTPVIPPTPEIAKAALDAMLESHHIEPGLREEMILRLDEYIRRFVTKEATIPGRKVARFTTYQLKDTSVTAPITRPLAASDAHIEDIIVMAARIGEDFFAHLSCDNTGRRTAEPVRGPSMDERIDVANREMGKRGISPEVQLQISENFAGAVADVLTSNPKTLPGWGVCEN